jgi:hypothetical protein
MPDFEARTLRLGELLADPYLIEVPTYQRAFVWKEKEAGKLLDDILSDLDAETNGGPAMDFFLGTMLFVDRQRLPSRRAGWSRTPALHVLEVVDGFQRLTTLTIIVCVLRDLNENSRALAGRLDAAISSGPKAKTRHRLMLRLDEAFFDAHVRTSGAAKTTSFHEELSESKGSIIAVRDHIAATLGNLDSAQRRALAEYLLERCCVVQVITSGIDRAHRMFTVLNAEGKPLESNDILKAVLLGNVPVEEAQRVTAIWEEAKKSFGREFESIFSHIRSMYRRPGDQVISAIRNIASEAGGPVAFIDSILQPSVAALKTIRGASHSGSPHSDAINQRLRYLNLLPSSEWLPPLLLWWIERAADAAELSWFIAALDRLAYCSRLLNVGTATRARRLALVSSAIRSQQDLSGPDSPLHFSRHEMRLIRHNLRAPQPRAGGMPKFLLLRANDVIAGQPQSLELMSDLTVEHVLPRRVATGQSAWRDWFPDLAEREDCVKSLGNLVLVTKSQNDRARNSDFVRKQAIYFETPDAPVAAVNEGLRNKSQWRPADIRAREAELVSSLEALWQFDDMSDDPPVPKLHASKVARRSRNAKLEPAR